MPLPELIFWLCLSVIGVSVANKYYQKFIRRYRQRMLEECLRGHMVIGMRIFNCWDATTLEGYVSEIKEWEKTYVGKVERGMLHKLHDQLQKEWHERYYLVKPRMVG